MTATVVMTSAALFKKKRHSNVHFSLALEMIRRFCLCEEKV